MPKVYIRTGRPDGVRDGRADDGKKAPVPERKPDRGDARDQKGGAAAVLWLRGGRQQLEGGGHPEQLNRLGLGEDPRFPEDVFQPCLDRLRAGKLVEEVGVRRRGHAVDVALLDLERVRQDPASPARRLLRHLAVDAAVDGEMLPGRHKLGADVPPDRFADGRSDLDRVGLGDEAVQLRARGGQERRRDSHRGTPDRERRRAAVCVQPRNRDARV